MRSSTGTEFWPRLMSESRQERVRLPNNTKQRKQVNNSKHISQILIRGHGRVREEPSSATVASRVGWLKSSSLSGVFIYLFIVLCIPVALGIMAEVRSRGRSVRLSACVN
jgi:hypothetical protein